jgi:transposase
VNLLYEFERFTAVFTCIAQRRGVGVQVKAIQEVLAPQLRPGQVVVLDHLKAHKMAGMREAIEARGAQLRYLPPYAPDFSPIEECWSNIKAL